MEPTLIISCFALLFSFFSTIILVVVLLKLLKTNKNFDEFKELLNKMHNENVISDKDMVEALSNVMKFLNNNFDNNFKYFQKQQEWLESNLAKVASLDTENSQKIYDSLYKSQVFLNHLGEFLGYRPKTNLGD